MRPLRLHLDTSDYAAMHAAAPGTEPARVREHLKALAQAGRIAIGLSYHVVFELLQDAAPQHRDDRLARARLLAELCGQNAFPYPSDLGQGYRFSTDGLWVPRIDLEDTEIERVLEATVAGLRRHPALPRNRRRLLARRQHILAWAREDPEGFAQFAGECWPLLFARSFAEDGDLGHYLLGTLSREEANRRIWIYFTDPVQVYRTWFELYGRDNPIVERRDRMAATFTTMLTELGRMVDEGATLRARVRRLLAQSAAGDQPLEDEDRTALRKLSRDLKAFRAEITSAEEMNRQVPRWEEIVGPESARVAAQIFQALHREKLAHSTRTPRARCATSTGGLGPQSCLSLPAGKWTRWPIFLSFGLPLESPKSRPPPSTTPRPHWRRPASLFEKSEPMVSESIIRRR
jgi:hypothetical protein